MRITLVGLLLAGCAGSTGDDAETETCPSPGAIEVLADGLTGGTEGIGISTEGVLAVSAGPDIVRILPDGSTSPIATVGNAIGLVWWRDVLHAASWETPDGEDSPAVVRLGDTLERIPVTVARPNFLAVTPWDTLLISDDFDDRILEIDWEGHQAVFVDGIESPNGMGFSPEGDALYVATTFVDPPALWRVPVSDGLPGEPAIVTTWDTGSAADGLVVAADGTVIVALNLAGELATWHPDRGDDVIATGLPTPASLAFGDGTAFDACSLYATSLFGETVSRIPVAYSAR